MQQLQTKHSQHQLEPSDPPYLSPLQYVETDMQQLQIKQRHEQRPVQEQVEVDYAAAARAKNPKRPIGFDRLPEVG